MFGRRSIKLTWHPSPERVDGYYVYRGRNSGQEGLLPVNKTIVLGTSYTDQVPIIGTFYYVVRSSRNGVFSKPSNEVKTKRLF